MKQWNEIQKANAANVNQKYFETQEKLATKLGEDAIKMLRSDLDRQNSPVAGLWSAFENWVDDVFTDQADAKTWLEDPDNALIIQAAIERVALSAPYIVNGWNGMSNSEKLNAISKDVIANLSENPAFAEELAEDLIVKKQDEAELAAEVEIANMNTGLDSPAYQTYLDLLEQRYRLEYGIPNIDEIRKNDKAAWNKIQEDWKIIWKEMQGS